MSNPVNQSPAGESAQGSGERALHVFNRNPYARSYRCVTCGEREALHVPGVQKPYCKGFATLNLPEGKTCGDCFHIRRCNAIFEHMATERKAA